MVEPEAESEPITVEWYEVITACDETRVSRIAIRDTPEVTEGNLALTVPVGTELKAVEDLGEFTRLTHDLYVMSKYVKPL